MKYAIAALTLTLTVVAGPLTSADQKTPTQVFRGKVVAMKSLLQKQGIKLDDSAAPHWMALVTDDGKVFPLVKDKGSRMFYLEPTLLDRPMQLTARVVPGAQMLQVLNTNSIINGKLHDVYWWCETCQLRFSEPGKCYCCGSETELIEEPLP